MIPIPFAATPRQLGTSLVLLAAVLWSTGGLLIRLISADELTVILWRSVSAAVALSIYLVVAHRTELFKRIASLGWVGLAVASCFLLDASLSVFAFRQTSVANVMVIFSTAPFVAGFIAWLWHRERVTVQTAIAMLVCIVGVVVMVSDSLGSRSFSGDLLAMLVVIVFSFAIVTIRRHPHLDLIAVVWLSAVMTAVVFVPFATPFGHTSVDYALMAVFGVFEYAAAMIAFTVGARYLPAAQSMLIGLLETVLGPLWVWLVISETPTRATLIGGGVIITTLVVHTTRALREDKQQLKGKRRQLT